MSEMEKVKTKEASEQPPWSYAYVLACIVFPIVGGGLNVFIYSGYSLYFRQMQWDLWITGVACTVGSIGRIFFQQLQLHMGLWTSAPMALAQLTLAILATIYPDQLWALIGQQLAVLCFDTNVLMEAFVFEIFSESEAMARKAAATMLSCYTVSYAFSATYGGLLYDLWSWPGIAWYHTIVASLNFLLILAMPPVWRSWKKLRSRGVTASAQDFKETRQRADSAQSNDSWSHHFPQNYWSPDEHDHPRRVSETEPIPSIPEEEPVDKQEPTKDKLKVEVKEPTKTKNSKIPAHAKMPAAMVFLNGFCNNYSYATIWLTYAIFFKEHHHWDEATWAGISQTSGDLLAAIMIALPFKRKIVDLQKAKGLRWLWYATTGQPYNITCLMVAWALLNVGITNSLLPVSIAAQVLMGTVYTYCIKANNDLSVYYSLGSTETFLAMQTLGRNAESFGAVVAGVVAMPLYEEISPVAPFLFSAGLSVLLLLLYTICFCQRLGFGHNIDVAEEARCKRLKIDRESFWTVSKATDLQEEDLDVIEL